MIKRLERYIKNKKNKNKLGPMLQVDTQYESYNIYWDPTLLTESSIQRNRLHIILAGSKKKRT